jgi:hypothetical protein
LMVSSDVSLLSCMSCTCLPEMWGSGVIQE